MKVKICHRLKKLKSIGWDEYFMVTEIKTLNFFIELFFCSDDSSQIKKLKKLLLDAGF